ncbi:HD-GYP domain-containing protein [Mesorhizobium australicum]|uniref:GAF domain-containing protein n=1 Tax=Mesorhizobium australicum TaxID=536018 RepID=A0A1X7PGG5_9HYPH|nr:HD domain-containing phosphohydrolase [Mesorhizobium australicum]SMH50365.1 GAF domain-containing protein [Mesorhizobium australicum]
MSGLAERAQIYDETGSLEDLMLQLSMARGIDEIMAVVRTGVRPLIGADGVTFVLRDHGMCHYAEEDAIAPLWKGQRFPMNTCISGWAMLHREAAIIEDIYADPRIPHAAYRPTFVRSLVMVPVRKEDPVAAMGIYWAQRRRPQDHEVRIAQRIANSAAVAMTNVALLESLAAARDEAVKAQEAIILALGSLAETRDVETGNHVYRTQHYVRVMAEAARARGVYAGQLDDRTIELIVKAAPLHDIGKVGVPDRILRKAGPLTARETAIMRTHAAIGRDAIAKAETHFGAGTRFFRIAQDIAYTHHEKWDGSGYPCGLAGEEIPLSGRLMAIADVYDALVSPRVYKAAFPHKRAVRIILDERGRHFDPLLVDVFSEVEEDFQWILHEFGDDTSR